MPPDKHAQITPPLSQTSHMYWWLPCTSGEGGWGGNVSEGNNNNAPIYAPQTPDARPGVHYLVVQLTIICSKLNTVLGHSSWGCTDCVPDTSPSDHFEKRASYTLLSSLSPSTLAERRLPLCFT